MGGEIPLRTRHARWILIASLIVSLLLSALAIADAAKKITFTTGVDTSFAQVAIAEKMGFFKKYGLDVTVKKFASGNTGFKTVLSGEADASVAATPGVITALAQGATIKVIGTSRAATGPYAAVAAAAEIKKPSDLHGKNVGVALGTSGSHQFFNLYVEYHKLDRTKINIKPLQAQEMVIAFSRGDIDAFFAWPPWWRRALDLRKGAHVLAYSNDNDVHIGTQTLVVSAELAKDREAVTSIVKAFIDAENYLKDSRSDAVKLLAKEYNMTVEEIDAELKTQSHRLELSETSFIDFRNTIDFMMEQKQITKAPDWAKSIDIEFLKAVDPSRLMYKKFIDYRGPGS